MIEPTVTRATAAASSTRFVGPAMWRFGRGASAAGLLALAGCAAASAQAEAVATAPASVPQIEASASSDVDAVVDAAQPAPPPESEAATEIATASLALTIRNVRAGKGPVLVRLVRGEEGWTGAIPAAGQARIEATAAEVTAVFPGLEGGTYGVKLYQDVDANGEMNTNMFGIPSEPYGFSNNAPVRFGPPDWEAAQFEITPGAAAEHAIDLPGRN
jgi:uncharacterized protein (DUF2141 family)